ncbi:MAG: prepilin peptidase [Lachnospiraceae bacterium]|nr:prepilin peptidase [Lachnospiraceae bacterium]
MILLSLLLLVICSFTDLRERGISVMLLAAFLTSSILLMISVSIFGDRSGILKGMLEYEPGALSIAASFVPGIILFVINRATHGAVGLGDVYMILILGFMMGAEKITVLIFVSMMMTALFGIIYMITGRGGRRDSLPYAPFLLVSMVLILIFLKFGKAA